MTDLSTSENDRLALLFKNETREQLERFTEILLKLEQNPEKQSEVINELFRLAHNIKGSSGMMGLNELKETMHLVENLFDGVRKTILTLDADKINALIEYCDEVSDYIEGGRWDQTAGISRWKERFDYKVEQEILPKDRFNNQLVLSDAEKQEIALWQSSGNNVYGIEIQFSLDAMMKSASALVFIKYLEKYGAIFKMVPVLEELAAEKFDILKVVLLVEGCLTEEQEKTIITYPVNDAIETRLRKWVYRPEEAKGETKVESDQSDHQEAVSSAAIGDQTIRVESSKIDKLVNNVGDLLTIKANLNRIIQLGYQGQSIWNQLINIVQKLEQTVANFQDDVKELRMVPVRQLFVRFPKIIRNIAKKENKQVELITFGEDTEIDKQVAEKLVDPLTHLIRNAVDHGLESGAERSAVGKPATGRIKLGAYKDGDFIVISVSDDGKGLDIDKIREKALKNGLIKADDKLNDEEVFKLIFAPGFSTAEEVSDISGRGVGLDVVLDRINALKGDIEVDTMPGQGTTFLLKLPLTLAIIQALLIKVGDQIFGIPSVDIVENVLINKNEIHTVAEQMVYTLRQEAFPVVDLRKLFKVKNGFDLEQVPMIVSRNSNGKMGLIVDELVGQEEVVIKQINSAFPHNPVISGAALLGGGEIALLINTRNLQTKY
ncbi:MAG: chemotaxis protein CheA [Firmicutes bacterium]|nr:chemotaxis protein CheA [Bacillota bacterium]